MMPSAPSVMANSKKALRCFWSEWVLNQISDQRGDTKGLSGANCWCNVRQSVIWSIVSCQELTGRVMNMRIRSPYASTDEIIVKYLCQDSVVCVKYAPASF